jgi:plasmid replication initiation protein
MKKQENPIELVQPNKVTNARHDYTEREENILTLMIDAIQKHMSKETPIETDLFGEPTVTIDIKEVGANNKSQYWEAAKNMRFKTFDFEYTNQDNKTEEVAGVLVTTVRNIRETSKIKVTINKWAIPYLLYWGKGVGGTIFNKTTALTLKGEYTKKLYKLCKRWEDKGGFSMSLDEFRKMLVLENKYPKLKDFKNWVLDKSIDRMKEGADVYFNYSLTKIGGSRSYNQINFTIHGNNKRKPKEAKTDLYVFVYNMLCIAYPNHVNSAAQEICDRIAERPDKFEELYRRMKKLKQELDDQTKTINDLSKLIKYIIKNDYK